jgi:hypothetical protein
MDSEEANMIITFTEQPNIGKRYRFENVISGEIEFRTITAVASKSRYSDIFKSHQQYLEVTLTTDGGRTLVCEYDINY